MAGHYWQKEDNNGDLCDEHIITRFDEDPEFVFGLTADEYMYFVAGSALIACIISTFAWYFLVYKSLLVPSGWDKQAVIVATLAFFLIATGYFTNNHMLKKMSNLKRGKPRHYLFHVSAWWLYKKLGRKPSFIFYEGSLDIKRSSK